MRKSYFYFMFLFGEAIIAVAFFWLLMPLVLVSKGLFVLNLIVSMFVFAVSFFRVGSLSGSISAYSLKDAGNGVFAYGVYVYDLAAIGTVIASFVMKMHLPLAVVIQLVLFFILCGAYFSSIYSNENANKVLTAIENNKTGLRTIANQLQEIDLNISAKYDQSRPQWESLKENIGYITASTNQLAISLEGQLQEKLSGIKARLLTDDYAANNFLSDISDCNRLVESRKKII